MLMKVLIVDDHILFRDGLTSLLESQPGFTVVGQVDSIAHGLQLIPQCKPDVILMDLDLPDGNGLEATQKILSIWPDLSVVIISVHSSEDYVLAAIQHGAVGYIPKDMPKEHFLASMRAIQHGEIAITRKMTRRLIEEYIRVSKVQVQPLNGATASLTFRELEVFHMLGAGASNQEIGENLHITENTVKSHVHKILEKLQLRSRLEARDFAKKLEKSDGVATGLKQYSPSIGRK